VDPMTELVGHGSNVALEEGGPGRCGGGVGGAERGARVVLAAV
jgi:hypothetical protein